MIKSKRPNYYDRGGDENDEPRSSTGDEVKILVEDGQPVEFGQTLVILK